MHKDRSASKATYKHHHLLSLHLNTQHLLLHFNPPKNGNPTMNDCYWFNVSYCSGAALSFHQDEDCKDLIVVKTDEGEEVEWYRKEDVEGNEMMMIGLSLIATHTLTQKVKPKDCDDPNTLYNLVFAPACFGPITQSASFEFEERDSINGHKEYACAMTFHYTGETFISGQYKKYDYVTEDSGVCAWYRRKKWAKEAAVAVFITQIEHRALRPRLRHLNWGKERCPDQIFRSPASAPVYPAFANQDPFYKTREEFVFVIALVTGRPLSEMLKIVNNMFSFRIGNWKSVVIDDVLLGGRYISPSSETSLPDNVWKVPHCHYPRGHNKYRLVAMPSPRAVRPAGVSDYQLHLYRSTKDAAVATFGSVASMYRQLWPELASSTMSDLFPTTIANHTNACLLDPNIVDVAQNIKNVKGWSFWYPGMQILNLESSPISRNSAHFRMMLNELIKNGELDEKINQARQLYREWKPTVAARGPFCLFTDDHTHYNKIWY